MSFSSAAPSGYLDFTNATPKAIKMIATSNIGVGTTVPAYALDVHGSANVGALHMTLPVTDIASNLVTYDKNTGQLFDSGGLFSNKLTVVSPHPPSAMSSDTTVITDHGTYVSAASSSATDVYAWQAFNETTSSYWETPPSYMGASNVYNGGSTQLASSTELGEWLTIEVPNEMTLRHIEVTPRTIASYPGSANLYATNDSVTWTEVKNWENVVPTNTSSQQIAVNATSAYKKYGMVTTKVSGNSSNLAIANLKLFGESLTFDNGHLSVTGLPMATVASNLVTYDKTTGKFFDSAGLFSNKLAVVSVQPPEALTGASTVVTGHGTYTIESPGVDAYKLFDKDDTTTWTGENVTVNLPYKTTLRYLKMMADTLSGTVTVEASHTDGLTWTTLVSGATIAETVLVNATQPYKKYKFSFGSSITLKTLDLFTESFSIDGGKVAMAQQPTTGGETVMDQHGPHGRLPKAVPLKKYPEISFESGKFDRNDTTNTYVQAGYTVTANSTHENRNHEPWKIFDGSQSNEWQISTTQGGDRYSESTGTYNTGVDLAGVTVADQTYNGDWVQVSLPRKIKVDHMNLATPATYGDSRMPEQGVLLGSNNGSSWSNVASFGQVSYPDGSFTRISINSAEYYSYYRMIWLTVTAGDDSTHRDRAALSEWELYGYEEDPPFLGDTSVDTTFTSIMNTPQTTGAQVYVDGSLGDTFTNRVVGPTVSNTHTTYVSAEKYWELSGALTSNVTLEANTFLSGDAPHSISMWFNSSNLEANVSNSCIFSLGTEEKLDHIGSDAFQLLSNTYEHHQKVQSRDVAAGDIIGHSNKKGVAISGDGSVAVFGSPDDDDVGGDTGSAYVFMKNASNVWVEVQKLEAGNQAAGDRFGNSVAISKDGNYIVVGAYLQDNSPNQYGAAYIFKRNGNQWNQEPNTETRLTVPSEQADDQWGFDVSISGDGTWVLMSSYRDNSVRGAVAIFKQNGTTWDWTKKLTASNGASNDEYGTSCNISADGNYIVVGARGDASNRGAMYVYYNNNEAWDDEYIILASDGASNDKFGNSTSISNDGSYVVTGSGWKNSGNDGAAYVYTRSGTNTWGGEQKLTKPSTHSLNGDPGAEYYGIGVHISYDGTHLVVSASSADAVAEDQVGAVYMYNRSGSNWNLITHIINPHIKTVSDDDYFGTSVALSQDGKYAIISAMNDDDIGTNAGAIYFYHRDKYGYPTHVPNFNLQSNTWHNLTYAYQGEGGSKVTYLDGRKVAEDRAEDTFGEYPPALTIDARGYGRYHATASSEWGQNSSTDYTAWRAFDDTDNFWHPYDQDLEDRMSAVTGNSTYIGFKSLGGVSGSWLKLKFPKKFIASTVGIQGRSDQQRPKDFTIMGSTNDLDWYSIKSFTGETPSNSEITQYVLDNTNAYKYLAIVVTKVDNSSVVSIRKLRYYGHFANDLVRLPDPTNVLKYPHVAMTGPAQRGYALEVSSSHTSTSFAGYQAEQKGYLFDGDASTFWHCNTNGTSDHHYNGNNSSYGTNSVANFDPTGINVKGEWIQLKFPHKLKISKVHLLARSGQEAQAPEDFAFYGSDNGSAGSWTLIQAFTGESPQDDGSSYYDITSNPAPYKYILMLMTRLVSSTGAVSLAGLQYYGTEEATSVPIQIGGGNIDKVANFRVYDKFVGEDQALEIWDAQKDEFGRAKSSMTLYKGRLGLGTDEPQGRLAVADEPDPTSYDVQEFPPGAMRSDIVNFEGYGTFKASASSSSHTYRYAHYVFDKGVKIIGSDTNSNSHDASGSYPKTGWISIGGVYATSKGYATTSASTRFGYLGEWIELELPFKIKLRSFILRGAGHSVFEGTGGDQDRSINRLPRHFVIWGYDGTVWEELQEFTTSLQFANSTTLHQPNAPEFEFSLPTAKYYNNFAVVIKRTWTPLGGGNGTNATSVGELRFFGTREQLPPKQSVLHDGQLTLTKNLTVPRIGPALDADDTPRRDRLVVEYNTSTNPTFNGAVRDTSGRGNDGTLIGNAYYSIGDKAFRFDGTNDHIQAYMGNSGDFDFTVSCWVNRDTITSYDIPWWLGSETQNAGSTVGYGVGLQIGASNDPRVFFFIFGGKELEWANGSSNFPADQWNHVVCTRTGVDLKLYLNGILQSIPEDNSDPLELLPNSQLLIGQRDNAGSTLDGSISQFKLYDTVLTAGDVKTLYDMGRCDEGHHVVNFSKTRVGIGLGEGQAPRSALDVRDLIYAESSSLQTFTGQHICFPDESMEKGLVVSAKKNQFVKLNGLAIGKSAITIDESLPIVSLSNVAQDKACFGVVSAMEESNAAYRTEITGGLVSESIKIAGDNRAVVNSVGEGAIWVVDTNGPLESGDYITTSNVAGYGQKQDDDVLHNFTVAKITMDCDFTASNVAVQTIKREQTGTQIITEDAWNQLVEYDRYSNVEDEITTYYHIQRGGNVLDENGQLQFEDKTGATEEPYERRFLTTDGTQTDEANAAHIAAFVGCTYHCG